MQWMGFTWILIQTNHLFREKEGNERGKEEGGREEGKERRRERGLNHENFTRCLMILRNSYQYFLIDSNILLTFLNERLLS